MNNLHMYSYGGVGTRMLYEWLKPHFKYITGQSQVHYEVPSPTLKLGKDDRVLYLYGNPVDSVCSFYGKDMENGKFIREHCSNLQIPTVTSDIHEFINNGEDAFKLYDHYTRYTESLYDIDPQEGAIIIIDYDDLWLEQEDFLRHMGLEQFADTFPKKRERSPKPWLSTEIREGITSIYKSMIEETNIQRRVLL